MLYVIICYYFVLQADVRAQYQSIDKETPVPADRQVIIYKYIFII